jgi:predicted CXXCH cytochrome family protein
MRKPARYGVAFLRTGGSLVGLWLAIVLLLLASCDEVERHNMLTFFFDGVPPLGGDVPVTGPSDSEMDEAAGPSPTGGWYVHEATKDCTQCHGSGRSRGGPGKIHLVAAVPQLCYQCHEELAQLEGWVHGPVANGACRSSVPVGESHK